MSDGAVTCPFCGGLDVEIVSAWAGQLITSQARCRGCNTYFEVLRDDFGPRAGEGARETTG